MKNTKTVVGRSFEKFLRIMNKYSQLEARTYDFGTGERLYPSEIHTIEIIGKRHHINVTGLAGHMGITKGAVSQMIAKLVRKGYVTKSRHAVSNKDVVLGLTPKGWQAFAGHERFHAALYEDFGGYLKAVSEKEVAMFHEVLDRIEKHIDTLKDK